MIELVTEFNDTATSQDVSDYFEQRRILDQTFADVIRTTRIQRKL